MARKDSGQETLVLKTSLSIFDPCSSTPDRTNPRSNRPIRNFAARGIACVAFSLSSSPVEKPCNSIISTDTHRSIHGVSIRNAFSTKDPSSSSPPPLLGPYLDPFRHVWSARQVIGSALVYIYRCRDSPRHLQRNRICFAAYSRGGGRGWMVIRSSFRGENSRRRGGREGHGMNL